VYALGCVAFELFCGSPPFAADHHSDLLVSQVADPPPRPSERRAGVDNGIDDFVLGLLAKDPARRPPGALEVIHRLDALAAAPATPAPADPVATAAPDRPSPSPRRARPVRLLADASLEQYRPMESVLSVGDSRPLTLAGDANNPARLPGPGLPPVPSETGPDATPAKVDQYEILNVLGRGAMGVVYLARDTVLDRRVALKMVVGGAHAGPEERKRFISEARAVASLSHPNIIGIYGVGEQGGVPYLALELAGGGTLHDRARGGPLAAVEAAALVRTLSMAIQVAHSAGVVHRDLKPANVLLTEGGELKISDFGLAKRANADGGNTASGAVLGTPMYMAPELARGDARHVGPGVDIYALGAMLYEFLTGRPPFRGATAVDTIMDVINAKPIPVRRLNPTVPRDLETICMKCLKKDPGLRYASAEDLATDLGRFIDGRPVAARAGRSLWQRFRGWFEGPPG
jgi:serine/threonine-protein kinase